MRLLKEARRGQGLNTAKANDYFHAEEFRITVPEQTENKKLN